MVSVCVCCTMFRIGKPTKIGRRLVCGVLLYRCVFRSLKKLNSVTKFICSILLLLISFALCFLLVKSDTCLYHYHLVYCPRPGYYRSSLLFSFWNSHILINLIISHRNHLISNPSCKKKVIKTERSEITQWTNSIELNPIVCFRQWSFCYMTYRFNTFG
jgi:hypothetical protein